MSYTRIETDGVPIYTWCPPDEIEPQALDQLRKTALAPWVHAHLAVMPDVHLGKGATVGSVIATKHAIMPAAVGVDIGCGVYGAPVLGADAKSIKGKERTIRLAIEKAVPVGFSMHEDDRNAEHHGWLWQGWDELAARVDWPALSKGMMADKAYAQSRRQLGTLGGGNHFLELCDDGKGRLWIVLHSGSRGVGNMLSRHYTNVAYSREHNQGLPDRDLSALLAGDPAFDEFIVALSWAQQYAWHSRIVMARLAAKALSEVLDTTCIADEVGGAIHCHHNYVATELHGGEEVLLTRKGAIRADLGVRGLVPGSMGTGTYMVSGAGNNAAFRSASHGAGRRMSRGQAKRTFTVADLEAQTQGVECRKDASIIDEAPGAYKDIAAVMEQQADLVLIDGLLRPLVNVKG